LSNLCVLPAAFCLQEKKSALQARAAAAAAAASSAGLTLEQREEEATIMRTIAKVVGIVGRWETQQQIKAADAALAKMPKAARVEHLQVRRQGFTLSHNHDHAWLLLRRLLAQLCLLELRAT
jgi:hypothetical protein